MTEAAIKSWLDSPAMVPGWEGRRGTWSAWLENILQTFFSEAESFSGKRPNCDSGWWPSVAISLCMVNSDVCDMYAYNELVELRIAADEEEEYWDRIYELESKLYDEVDGQCAQLAFNAVIDYLFRR